MVPRISTLQATPDAFIHERGSMNIEGQEAELDCDKMEEERPV